MSIETNYIHASITKLTDNFNDSIFTSHPFFGPRTISKTSLKDWPKKTDVVCYYDGERFDTIPIPICKKYDYKRDLYHVHMFFCSFSCALAYLHDHHNSCNKATQILNLQKMARDVFQYPYIIKPASSIYLLQKYAGDKGKTIDDWRKDNQFASTITLEPPFILYPMVFQELKAKKSVTSHTVGLPVIDDPVCKPKDNEYIWSSNYIRIPGNNNINNNQDEDEDDSLFKNFVDNIVDDMDIDDDEQESKKKSITKTTGTKRKSKDTSNNKKKNLMTIDTSNNTIKGPLGFFIQKKV